jgi:hypothetical protein
MSLFRITSQAGDTLAAAQSLDGLTYVIGRHFSPGRYDIEVIGETAPASDSGGRRWGSVIRHDDGQVSLEPRPMGSVTRVEHPDSYRRSK